VGFIRYLLTIVLSKKIINKKFFEDQKLEFIWTLFPLLILVFIVMPSIKILYLIEENNYSFSLKVTGHQWYWSYEYPEFDLEFDSYIAQNRFSLFRLLDVDNRVSLPNSRKLRFIISSEDVIHSWAIPSLGLKMDAIPGRLNYLTSIFKHYGLFFGQCSEICGTNHRFIPISLEITNLKTFLKWINSF